MDIPFTPDTLTEALQRKTDYCPRMRQEHAGKSMKTLAKNEYTGLDKGEELHCIVLQTGVAKYLLDDINKDLKDIRFDLKDPHYPYFIPLVDQPIKWHFGYLPPIINSESDVRSIFDSILVRPAIAGIQLIEDTRSRDSHVIDLTGIKSYLEYWKTFYASGIKQDLHVVPDSALYKNSEDSEPVTLCTTELKLDSLISHSQLDILLSSTNDEQTKQTAIPFKYPAKGDTFAPDVLCRLIVQMCDSGLYYISSMFIRHL